MLGRIGNLGFVFMFSVISKVYTITTLTFVIIFKIKKYTHTHTTFCYSPGSCPGHLRIETSGCSKRPATRGKWSSRRWRRSRQIRPKCGSRISAGSASRWWWTSSRWCSSPAGWRSPSLSARESLLPRCLRHLLWEGQGGADTGSGVRGGGVIVKYPNEVTRNQITAPVLTILCRV